MGASERLEDQITQRIAERATGALEVTDDRKRWHFFFEGGEVIATKSNLKSEQEESLRRTMGDAPESDLLQVQTTRRIVNAARCEGSHLMFTPRLAPPRRQPSDIRRALFDALRELREPEDLRAELAVFTTNPPLTLHDEAIGTGTPLDGYLAVLDGVRPLADVLDFAPMEPQAVLVALWMGWRLGILKPEGLGTVEVQSLDESGAPVQAPALVAPSPAAAPVARSPSPGHEADFVNTEDASSLFAAAEGLFADPRPARPSAPARALEVDYGAPPPAPRGGPATLPPLPRGGPATLPPLPPRGGPATLPPLPRGGPATLPPLPPAAPAHPMAARLAEIEARFSGAQHHFDLLGESWESPPEVLRTAYMRLARDLHPDRYTSAPPALQDKATELFDRVRAAWEDLSEDSVRHAYINRVIHGQKSEDELAMEQVQAYLHAETAFKRGLAAFHAGQSVVALGHFKAAHEGAPDELEFRAYLGYTTFMVNVKKDPPAAMEGFKLLEGAVEKNLAQEKKKDAMLVLLARAWRERGNAGQARRAAVAALKIDGNNQDAFRLLRRLDDDAAAAEAPKGAGGKIGTFLTGLFKKKDG